MKSYRVSNGNIESVYEANSAAEALLLLHLDAGYTQGQVYLDRNGNMRFGSPEYEALLGGMNVWTVEEVA